MLQVEGVTKRFGGVAALTKVDLAVAQDDLVGIIGPNGSGKTTLLNVIVGVHRPTEGRLTWRGQDITAKPTFTIARLGLVRTFQQAIVFRSLSVLENIRIAAEAKPRSGDGESEAPERTSDRVLDFAGLARVADTTAGNLPYGLQRKLGIAMVLATDPAMLLLDEPSAGLNDEETAELREWIRTINDSEVGVCLVDHDMSLVMPLARRIVVLDEGTKIAEGTPSDIRTDPRVLEVYFGEDDSASAG